MLSLWFILLNPSWSIWVNEGAGRTCSQNTSWGSWPHARELTHYVLGWFLGKINQQGIFEFFYHLVRVLVVEIVPHGRKRPRYSIVNIMAADDLAPCVARASAAMLLILLSRNIPTPASVDNILPPSNALTLKWLGHFFQNVISFSDAVHFMCNIFFIKLVQYNKCLVSIVGTDGLVL